MSSVSFDGLTAGGAEPSLPLHTRRLRYERQHRGWSLKPSMACVICSPFSTIAFFSRWTPADSILNCRRQTLQHYCATSSSRRAPTLADQKSGSLAFKLQHMSGQTLTPGWVFVKSAWQNLLWRGERRCDAGSLQAQCQGRLSCYIGRMVAGTDIGPVKLLYWSLTSHPLASMLPQHLHSDAAGASGNDEPVALISLKTMDMLACLLDLRHEHVDMVCTTA